VNVAARLEALAEPGGICVSLVVRDQVRDKLDFLFEELGQHRVKNIARPMRVCRVQDQAVPIEQPLAASQQALPMPDGAALTAPSPSLTSPVSDHDLAKMASKWR
jgi:hypothetical protein